MSNNILCVGEILWDALPSGLYLGGAPYNVSVHLHELGEGVSFASRVGRDRLGQEVKRRVERAGISTDLIQTDDYYETGFVEVELDANGNPEYTIIEPVAWDHIELEAQLKQRANEAWGIVFGSLAQRKTHSRETISNLLESSAKKILDLNIREPFYDKGTIQLSMKAADVLKFNEVELELLTDWFNLPADERQAMEKLSSSFECETVCMTRGSEGSILFHEEEWSEHPGFCVSTADAVGAGDAFLAALISGLHQNLEPDELLSHANATGAYVATQNGATPHYTMHNIIELKKSAEVNQLQHD